MCFFVILKIIIILTIIILQNLKNVNENLVNDQGETSALLP